MKKAQIDLSIGVDNREITYAAFGTINPIANLVPSFLKGG